MSKRVQATPLFIVTPERKEFKAFMIQEGWSERRKNDKFDKWIRDDENIIQLGKELGIEMELQSNSNSIMVLRRQIIDQLVYNYKLYQECDKRNKEFWLDYEEGQVLPDSEAVQWFHMNPNYWYETGLRPIYNKLYCMMTVANHPEDPASFPIFMKDPERKISFNYYLDFS